MRLVTEGPVIQGVEVLQSFREEFTALNLNFLEQIAKKVGHLEGLVEEYLFLLFEQAHDILLFVLAKIQV